MNCGLSKFFLVHMYVLKGFILVVSTVNPNNCFVSLQFPINSIVPLLTLSLYITFAFKITIHRKKIDKLMNPAHHKILNVSPKYFAKSTTEGMKSSSPKTKRTTFKAQNNQDDAVDDEVHSFHYEDSSEVNEESNSNKSMHELEHFDNDNLRKSRASMVSVNLKKSVKSYMEIWKGSYKNSTVSLVAIMVHILCFKNLSKYFITF